MVTTFRENDLDFALVKEVDGNSIILHASKLECEFDDKNFCAEVGAYVNCGGAHGDTICTISKVQVIEVERTKKDNNELKIYTDEKKVITLSLIGYAINGKFQRGAKRLPTINCKAFFLNSDQVNSLIGIDLDEDKEHFCVTSEEDDNQTFFNLDKLMGRHTAILGTTGSGKSCTVASIVQSILNSYIKPRILFFDIHNEYTSAFGFDINFPHEEYKNKTNALSWNNFSLPYWFLDLEEFIGVFNLDAGSNQKAILKEHIIKLKNKEIDKGEPTDIIISVDTPIFFNIDELIENLKKERDASPKEGKPKSATDKKPYSSMILKLQSIREDTRYSFLCNKIEKKIGIGEYFELMLGLKNDKYLNILDLSGLPAEVRAICVGIIARLCFDFKYWDLDPNHLPLNLILEEAHTYIPEESDSTYSICKQRVERIAKEGRKYGIGLTVVTQRPSSVSTTVLSQCGTYITLRLTNDLDQNKIKRLLPDTLSSQVDFLPSLRDGEAFVSGDSINIPRKVQFKAPSPMPKSNDVRYHEYWKSGLPEKYSLQALVDSWLKQDK